MQFLSAYLDSLYNFLSENVYFYYHRGSTSDNIQVQRLECPAKAQISSTSNAKRGDLMTHDHICFLILLQIWLTRNELYE